MATGESINTDILSDETFELLCSICRRHGKYCEAEKFCVGCNNYYCLICVGVHEDVPLLSGHKILDKGQFKTSKGLSVSQQESGQTLPAPTERCNKHNHYYIDMYCEIHDDVGCPACIATDHRSCHDTFYIPDFLKHNATIQSSKEIAQSLEEVDMILTKNYTNLQHKKQKLLKAKANALENIEEFRKEIDARLDKLEQNTINEIESLYTSLIEEIEKGTKEVQNNKSNIKSAQNKLASPGSNVSQVFVNAKTGKKMAKLVSIWVEENKTQIPEVNIYFKVDQMISEFLEAINTLGIFIQGNRKDEGSIAGSAKISMDQQLTPSQSSRKYPATFGTIQQRHVLLQGQRQRSYTVKVTSDDDVCDIISACALEDGTIILSDHNNNQLKCLSSSTYTVTDHCDLSDEPWQVCAISEQEVAVCLPDKYVVQFISVGSRMTKTREINTDFECYGLAYANDNLYISDSNTSVYIYSMTGRELKQFSLDKYGQRLFSDIWGLAVLKDGSRIYVADMSKGLIVLDNNGQVVRQFNGPQLQSARGCYLTDTGSLLVCGEHSHNVLQFGSDGELIGEVVNSDTIKEYKAVCCNQQMAKLILGSLSDEIEVNELVYICS